MRKIAGLIIVIVLSYRMISPMLSPGYFPMHDDTQVARVVELGRALRQGQFPVRWVSELGYGYGYPIFNFYGPLPYYVGGFFYALGLAGLTATKIMMILGLVLSGVSMYIVASEFLGISGGILAATLYMYAPYHAVDAYVRGAVGEYWALIFLPLIYMGFRRYKVLTGAVGIAGLVISHTILGYAAMVFIALAAIAGKFRKSTVFMIILGLGLSAFFWLPAITEMKFTNVVSQIGGGANFRDHFVCLPQLWNSLWGYGGSAPGCLDGFTFKIGKIHLLLGVTGLVLSVIYKKRLAALAAIIFFLAVFFMLPVSKPVWEVIPDFAFIQYPWRFLAFAIFGISLSGAATVMFIKNSLIRRLVTVIAVAAILLVESKWFVPQYTYTRDAAEFETAAEIRFRVSRISDEYLPASVIRPTREEEVLIGKIPQSDVYSVKTVQDTDIYKKFDFIAAEPTQVLVLLANFPGWEYHVNDDIVNPALINGLPVISIPAGRTVVQIIFKDTVARRLGNILSILSVICFLIIYDRKNNKTIG